MTAFQRILIIGCPGAGKSTLTRRLSARTGLPVTHLDQLYWQPGWVEDNPGFDERMLAAVASPRWIIDGGLTRRPSFHQRLNRADAVVLLDFPRWLCLWRVARRTIIWYGRDRPDMRAGCPERFDWRFLVYIWRWRLRTRPHLLEQLKIFAGPVIQLTTPAAARRFLDSFGPSPAVTHG